MRMLGRSAIIALALLFSVNTAAVSAFAEDTACFVLCECNGKIVLFSESANELLAVYKTPLTSLSPADAELLREGIRLKDRAEVVRLIEDLGVE